MRRRPFLALVPALSLAWTCASAGEPGTSARLTVEPPAPSPGDSIRLVLTNPTTAPVGYNLCTSELEALRDGSWEVSPSDRMCTMEIRTLSPDSAARFGLRLPADLEPGQYRFRTTIHHMEAGTSEPLRTDPFSIGG